MMRRNHVFPMLLLAMMLFGFVKRHHLGQLFDTIQTYTWFHFHLAQHPETLFQYHPSGNFYLQANRSLKPIPKIIHRIMLQEGQTSLFESNLVGRTTDLDSTPGHSCRLLHPDWTYLIWTSSAASRFMQTHYPDIWPHYQSYRQTIQRANILRYAVLHYHGGVYLDWDIECLQPLDELRQLPWLTPGAHPVGVNNAFILSKPEHPFLAHLLAGVDKSDLSWGLPYVENMLSTGCMFLSNVWMSYTRPLGSTAHKNDILYVLADENGRLEPHMLRGAITTPLFRHRGLSSWHSWDAGVILLIGQYYRLCLFCIGSGVGFVSLILATRLCRRVKCRNVPKYLQSRRETRDEEQWLMEG